nr:unnamed protein product [Digitaria exilis]
MARGVEIAVAFAGSKPSGHRAQDENPSGAGAALHDVKPPEHRARKRWHGRHGPGARRSLLPCPRGRFVILGNRRRVAR